jgi:hypothetical protein
MASYHGMTIQEIERRRKQDMRKKKKQRKAAILKIKCILAVIVAIYIISIIY